MEQDLRNLIKEELQAWKAPADLVARTKEAAAREEAKIAVRQRRKLWPFFSGAAVVAAAAILVFFSVQNPGPVSYTAPVDQSEALLRLGAADGLEADVGGNLSVERVKALPMAFRQEDHEEVINGVTVQYALGNNDVWMAALEDQGDYVVVSARVESWQEMHVIIEKLLSSEE